MTIDPFVLKMQVRKALGVIKGFRWHVSDADEDVIVDKLLEELDVVGYEIVKKRGNAGRRRRLPGRGCRRFRRWLWGFRRQRRGFRRRRGVTGRTAPFRREGLRFWITSSGSRTIATRTTTTSSSARRTIT